MFEDLERTQALSLARDEFPEILDQPRWTLPKLEEGQRIDKYLGPNHAIVREGKKRMVMQSTLPLRVEDEEGRTRALSTDLSLEGDALVPSNPLAETRVGVEPDVGFEFPAAGITVRPDAAGGAGDGQRVGDDRVFWPNVATDTDLVAAMLPSGLETFHMLRSQQSPQQLRFSLELPAGAKAVADGQGGVLITKNGEPAMTISPPAAADADGVPVEVSYTDVTDQGFAISVAHRTADVKYPVQVDPTLVLDQRYWNYDGGIYMKGWEWSQMGNWHQWHIASTGLWGRGFYIANPANYYMGQGFWGAFRFKAPGDTYIHRAEFGQIAFADGGVNMCWAEGIKSGSTFDWEPGWWAGANQPPQGAAPFTMCNQQLSGGYAIHGANAPTRGNYAVHMMYVPTSAWRPASSWSFFGGAAVFINDDQPPVGLSVSGLPANQGWTATLPTSIGVQATDQGLGMWSVALWDEAEQRLNGSWTGCEPDNPYDQRFPCPAQASFTTAVHALPGDRAYLIEAMDAASNLSYEEIHVRWDPTAPRVDLEPGAKKLTGKYLSEDVYPIKLHPWDSADPAGRVAGSGVSSVEFLVDGVRQELRQQSCEQGCSFDFRPFDQTLGDHTLKLVVKDAVGNESVEEWTVTVGSGAALSPLEGTKTPRRLTLEAKGKRSGLQSVRWQYRRQDSDTWADVPHGDLRYTNNDPVASPDLALTNGESTPVSWDLLATTALGNQDGPVQVRGVFTGGPGGSTQMVKTDVQQSGLDGKTAREDIGPGAVNLMTGNFSLPATDVEFDGPLADLTVARTYNSRAAAGNANGMFGPGWTTSLPTGSASSEYSKLTERPNSAFVDLTLSDGTQVAFTKGANGFEAEYGYTHLTLKKASDTTYTIEDLEGGTTTFEKAADSDAFLPKTVQQKGSDFRTRYVTEEIAGVTRVKRALAPSPPDTNCAEELVRGCKALLFTYSDTTTATGTSPSGWGDYAGRVSKIELHAWDPATSAMVPNTVARYDYDSNGRLRAAWDPRLTPALKRTYAYDADGLLITVTPPGEEPWTFDYTQRPSDHTKGRLASISRSALSAGTATTTVVYGVPLSGTGAPFQMAAGDVAAWGQQDVPTDATAIFGPDQVPGNPVTSYSRATIHYLDRDGYLVNEIAPGGHVTTTEHDRYGNATRELTAANRARALQAGGGAAALAAKLDTRRQYESSGLRMVDEVGPEHTVRLANGDEVRARKHTTVVYDEGAPSMQGPFHLPTTSTVAAAIAGQADTDARVTKTAYDWKWRKPISVTQDAASGGLAIVNKATYDEDTGLEISRSQPRDADGNDAGTTRTTYYTKAANSTHPACGERPEWQNLVCRIAPAAQPGTPGLPDLPVTAYAYDRLGLASTVTETVGSESRTTTTTRDGAGRTTAEHITGTVGTATPQRTTIYSSATGRAVMTSATQNGTTKTITRTFDALGRMTAYEDADGAESTTAYDQLSRPTISDDGKGTQTRTYDPLSGLLTELEDSAAGSFEATYNADGALQTRTLPNGLVATVTTDEAGDQVRLRYQGPGCGSTCDWDFRATPSIHGQWLTSSSPASSQTYEYDRVGRLTEVADTHAGAGCVVRAYAYDANSNRTSVTRHDPGSGGACDRSGADATRSTAHDEADRIITSGFAYDAFGRTTTVPAAHAGGHELASSYFVDDRLREQTQDGLTRTYTLDPSQRVRVRTSSGASSTVETTHYNDDTDSPSWTELESGFTRNIEGVDGDLAAIRGAGGTVRLRVANLHGDVVGTVPATGAPSANPTFTETDEFGIPMAGPVVPTAFDPPVVDEFTRADGSPGPTWDGPMIQPFDGLAVIGHGLGSAESSGQGSSYWNAEGASDSFDFAIQISATHTSGQMALDLVAADAIGGSQADGMSFTYYDGGDGTGRADVYQQVNGSFTYVTTVVASAYASSSQIGLRYSGAGSDGLTLYTKSPSGQWEQVWQGDPGIDGPAYAGPRTDWGTDAGARFDNAAYQSHYPSTAGPRYGWVGAKARSTELPSGVVQMGVRSYVPALGRFLQVDPVEGGSATTYDYANQDPVNTYDLSGECPVCVAAGVVGVRVAVGAAGRLLAQRAAQRARQAAINAAIARVAAANRAREARIAAARRMQELRRQAAYQARVQAQRARVTASQKALEAAYRSPSDTHAPGAAGRAAREYIRAKYGA